MVAAAAIIGGATAASAGIGAVGATSAAGTASSAAQQSAALQAQVNAWNQGNAQNFINAGTGAELDLWNQVGNGLLAAPFNMSEANLQATPGYQFTLNQGLQSTQNAAAARGLGVSGAALKGAATYATGLADQTYTQQLQNYWADQNNRYNALAGIAQTGANVSVGAGTNATTAASNTGNALTTAGTLSAQGTVGATNATSSGINSLLNNAYIQNYLTGGSTLSSPSSVNQVGANLGSNYVPNVVTG